MNKQGLEAKQVQTQKLSPQQIQTIKLIELPIQDLELKIRQTFDENPVLDDDPNPQEDNSSESDEPKDISLSEVKDDGDIPYYRTHIERDKDELPQYNTFSVKESFSQSLITQLGFRNLDDRRMAIGRFIICSLDDDGYLRRDIDSIVDDLAFKSGIETDYDEVLDILEIIQDLEPAGVGARDLQECLLLQLQHSPDNEVNRNAIVVIENYFKEFAGKHHSRIMARTGMDERQLKEVTRRIMKLNPAPGGQIDDSYNDRARQVIPDFKLRYDDITGGQVLEMPRFRIPEIRVRKEYSEMVKASEAGADRAQKEAIAFVKQKYNSAKWFVEALKQRQNTLMKTMQAILDYQPEYFKDGDESKLRPMVLKDIAEKTGFDISTISRVVNSKYIETTFGIMPLKYFFSEGLANQDGEEVSTRELKTALKDIIDAEDKRRPLTDEQLVDMMTKRGYKVARRTVAKYRDQLGIPTARLRKDL